ncbi:uncharacterized protein SPSK_08987 [Sporothrix schenckii 1099-18]|uniref:SET domain-containing protein n=1 Tax=Sporothrix schenckii 1099-18 TaxID=1397361 RepID=A0A0F2M8B1_SPOSC|nr:uncharacterized protein SPSK_08987 [Sporothrix schenckii 1099-18]KJR85324.1 hypothetical protein SPSK_08987 [Sporothrix schenckii 1099-18]
MLTWLLLLSALSREGTAADAASSSTSILIPMTASSHTAPSAAPSIPPFPTVPNVQRPTVRDVYDDDNLTSPRLCRNVGGKYNDALLRAMSRQCQIPVGNDAVQLPPSSWSPWSHPPACSEVNTTTSKPASDTLRFCVYTHASYGGGISIVATPETAAGLAAVLDQASVAKAAPPINGPHLKIQHIPGKGLGVVAGQAIPRGTVLLRDHARLLADVRFPLHVRRAQGQTLLHKAAGRLPDPDDVRSLSRSVKAKPGEARGVLEENILSTNSFAVTVEGFAYMALFPEIALRDTDFGLTHDTRQETLKRRWGFSCTCDLCSGGPDATAASDVRRRRVTALRAEVVAHLQQGAFDTAIAAYEGELLSLVRTEQLAEHMGEHYEVLARLHLAAGNRTAAATYAQRALDELETLQGAIDPGSVARPSGNSLEEMRAFVKALRRQDERQKKQQKKRPKTNKKGKRQQNKQNQGKGGQ